LEIIWELEIVKLKIIMDGILIINKEKGWTSFDVVAKIRGKLKVKKIGHTGTLDPMATGVLVLCLGKATKLAQEITGTDKEYVAEITLGATSNTDDIEGEIIHDSRFMIHESKILTEASIKQILGKFKGTISQIPPQFSAKKINGQRAYKLARKGKEFELKPVQITIHEIELIDYKWPVIKVRVFCGKGTYIRSLARDIGKELGVGGYLSRLERTKVGDYLIDQSVSVEAASEKDVLPV
jgi:tRNA pseudouridine55 synthase